MNIKSIILSTALVCGMAGLSTPAYAGKDAFLGEIIIVGFDFCPRGFAEANGRLMRISQNKSLFSLLGTRYGGDGSTSFALPDLRGRMAMGPGPGPGLTSRRVGERGGSETIPLRAARSGGGATNQMTVAPDHNRQVSNLPPFQVVRYCIALNGIYPSSN